MKYVNLNATVGGVAGVADPADYLDKLPGLALALPPGAREFAVDKDHYDFSSSRCVKDLKIAGIRVTEDGAALELCLRHNCSKRNDDLVIRYQASGSWPLSSPTATVPPRGPCWDRLAGSARCASMRSSRTSSDAATRSPAGPAA